MKIKEALLGGTEILRAKEIYSARLDSEVLLMHTLGLSRTELYLQYERELTSEENNAYRLLIAEREKKVPVAYLRGKKEFMSLEFKVDSRVLIPRPETELLVEVVLRETKKISAPLRVLDIGTGSGAIALSLAFYNSGISVYALDYSSEALEVALENACFLGLKDKVEFLQGDLWEGLSKELRNNFFQVIVSNPPYISRGEMLSLDREVVDYEPHLALEAGADGLDFYRRLSQGLPTYLAPAGLIALEVGKDQSRLVKELLEDTGIFSALEILKDYAGIERIVIGWRAK